MDHSSRSNHSSLIGRAKNRLAACLPNTPLAWMGWMAMPLVLGASFMAFSQATPPAYPAVNLATEPLYAAVTVDKPTLALALSVEFPTVGAQYLDANYSNTSEYLGYYDAESCYNYNNAPTETPATGLNATDYKRFDRVGAATSRQCSNAFSGNFLNWASNSAIDMLRLALSGGDRYIDTADLTILQRAVLPNGDPVCFWNTGNFPSKRLPRDGGGANTYWGAVPTAMITQANGSDIFVANTLNRIYFGTSATGGCGNTGAYTLGGPVSGNSMESPIRSASSLPTSGMTQCINGETGTCSFTGVKEVWYGAGSKWFVAAANNGVNCTAGCNAVFGDPIGGTAKKVYYRNYTGSWTPPAAGALNSDGFFYSRVQVCNVNTTGTLLDARDYGLCKQYPSGKYKPVGVIQKYSDQMRLAAFGYLMDQTASYSAGRYGGVLRAPMKYVGTKTFDVNGADNTPAGGNAAAEWNATTGVFATNPDGDTTQTPAISGVINYLNKFGRTGPVPGRYKRYDPVGELHYETVRYLQGLQPSADAVSGITPAMSDGYPVFTNWTDPYGGGRSNTSNYACVKSNIVVVGDTNTHDGNRLPTPNAANNIPDIAGWRTTANRFERNTTSQTYVDGQGVTQPIANPNAVNNSMPTGSQTSQIIGSSYWAHVHDIRGAAWTETAKQRPGLRVKTFLFDVNENGSWTDFGARSTSNQFVMAAKYGGFETDPANRGAKPYNTKGNPFKREAAPTDVNDNAVWQKAGTPGDPLSYYLQSNARGVLNAFDEIFGRAATAARSIAGGASSSNSASSSTALYTARFDTSNWSGDVVAEPVTANSTFALTIGAPTWSAANRLDNRTSAATSRNIVAGRESAVATPAATNFTWGAIDAALQVHLNKATPASAADALGQDRLNFIRGDRTREGSPFRVRSSLLGDVVNSNVVYSGAPGKGFAGAGYTAFATAFASRTPAVFAGANDGMLHAFNANTGDELFGFIPSWLGPKLSALTDPTFATTHQNYVDAPIAVGEAQVASTNAATDWKTVLVSGTGGGGSGVFALDVSDPSAFDASKVMWEFKRSDDADIGQVIGEPRIMKFKTSGSAATATYRWFAVVASGVNNYVSDAAGIFSTTGKPTLFLLALDKPVGTAWAEGTNYYKIAIPVDTTLAGTTAPGVVNFNALYGSSGEVTDIFMGDMHGKMWKLWFNPALTPSDWTMDNLSYFKKAGVAFPMFIAKTGTTVQPITAPPALFTGPTVGGLETFYVTFGTGKYLESADNISTLTNSFYALYDNGSATADTSPAGEAAISGRGRLIAGSVDTTTKIISVGNFTWGRPATDATTTSRAGWYFDMPVSGEKLVSNVMSLTSRTAAFNTLIPGATGAAAGSCSNSPGSGNQYVLDVLDGDGRYVPSTVGLLGPAMFLTVDTETSETKSDSTGRRIRTTVQRALTVGQSGVSPGVVETTKETVGRLTWRQIYNYQDQKN